MTDIKLTELAHGGGCGCKIAPAVLSSILKGLPETALFPNLLVGLEHADDAAVYRINNQQAIVATTDFFMPIVDDPHDFGRIAATNALSDIYAMGARPILALAILGMPVAKLPLETIQSIVAGGASVCASAGIPLAGGHSIDTLEPIYGLVALGLVDPDKIKSNNHARDGDSLILTKPLGIGILSAALKKGELSEAGYQQMLKHTTRLNDIGMALGQLPEVHAMTDVTGFGLLGHLLEICRASSHGAEIAFSQLPIIPEALKLAESGHATGASTRNWSSYGQEVDLAPEMTDWQKKILTDPQTSGGLLITCQKAHLSAILELLKTRGFEETAVIGKISKGPARVTVTL